MYVYLFASFILFEEDQKFLMNFTCVLFSDYLYMKIIYTVLFFLIDTFLFCCFRYEHLDAILKSLFVPTPMHPKMLKCKQIYQ